MPGRLATLSGLSVACSRALRLPRRAASPKHGLPPRSSVFAAAPSAVHLPPNRGLTLRSSGRPPASHLGREVLWYMLHLAAKAPCRRPPLSSNVRALESIQCVSKRAPPTPLMSSVAPRLKEQAARPSVGSAPSVTPNRSRGVSHRGGVPHHCLSSHLGAEANPAFARLEVPCALTNGEANGYQGTAESSKTAHPARQRPSCEAGREAPPSRCSRATEGASRSKTGVRRNWQVASTTCRGSSHHGPARTCMR
jgi:hypothetical protein